MALGPLELEEPPEPPDLPVPKLPGLPELPPDVLGALSTLDMEQKIQLAINAFKGGIVTTITAAAARWKVPYHRLAGRLRGRKPRNAHGASHTLLKPDEELALLSWINHNISNGTAPTTKMVVLAARFLISKRPTNEKQRDITTRWATRWMRRHSEAFKHIRSKSRSWLRKGAQSKEEVSQHFQDYQEVVREYDILPDNQWNGDESGFRVGCVGTAPIWTYTEIKEIFVTDPEDRTLVTVVEAISATGMAVPPFVILPGVCILSKHVLNPLEDGAALATSPNGYINDQIALEWFAHWEKHSRPFNKTEKRLLILDGHPSHLTIEFVATCETAGVVLFLLPPHSTHKLQPLDVGIFQIYKHYHREDILRQVSYGNTEYNKVDFLYGLERIRGHTFKRSSVTRAWELSGLWPFNPSLILDALEDPISSVTDVGMEAIASRRGYIPPLDRHLLPGEETPTSRKKREEDRRQYKMVGIGDEMLATVATPPKNNPYTDHDWSQATTPPMNLACVDEYTAFVRAGVAFSVENDVPVSPTILHVMNKRDITARAMNLVGVKLVTEDRQRKKAKAARDRRNGENGLVARYGPISAGDARLRVAVDDFNRTQLKLDEEARWAKKIMVIESRTLTRWVREMINETKRWCKMRRQQMRVENHTRKEISNEVNLKLAETEDISCLMIRYRAVRADRQRFYLAERHKAISAREAELGREEEEVILPSEWEPPGERPLPPTPWMVDEEALEQAIAEFEDRKAGEDMEDEEEEEADDIEEVVVVCTD